MQTFQQNFSALRWLMVLAATLTSTVLFSQTKQCTAGNVYYNCGAQTPIPTGRVTRIVFGNLQVHHPCSGHIQTHIFAQLPKRYGEPKVLTQMCKVLFRELGIAEDETYDLHYTDAADSLGVSQRMNREGLVDAI